MTNTNPFASIGNIISENGLMDELMSGSKRHEISIDKIEVEEQVRRNFCATSINELAKSIEEVGVLQNIIVNTEGAKKGCYRLIAGERRLMAAESIGLKTIPALVVSVSDEAHKQIQMLENIQRENLTAVELANQLKTELEELNGNYDELAIRYSKSRSWLSKAIRMADLTDSAAEAMAVTSDQEALLSIQALQEIEPESAKELVQEIADDFGKTNTRKKTQDALKKAKAKKKHKEEEQDAFDFKQAEPQTPPKAENKAETPNPLAKPLPQPKKAATATVEPLADEPQDSSSESVADEVLARIVAEPNYVYAIESEKGFWKHDQLGYCKDFEKAGAFNPDEIHKLLLDGRIDGCTIRIKDAHFD